MTRFLAWFAMTRFLAWFAMTRFWLGLQWQDFGLVCNGKILAWFAMARFWLGLQWQDFGLVRNDRIFIGRAVLDPKRLSRLKELRFLWNRVGEN
jgi:hypothetical protein